MYASCMWLTVIGLACAVSDGGERPSERVADPQAFVSVCTSVFEHIRDRRTIPADVADKFFSVDLAYLQRHYKQFRSGAVGDCVSFEFPCGRGPFNDEERDWIMQLDFVGGRFAGFKCSTKSR